MAGNISQAEKWRLWKQKMQANTPTKPANKHPDNVPSPNMDHAVVADTRISSQYNQPKTSATYDECNNTKDKTKTYDKTVHMVEEFISQCRQHVDKSNEAPIAFDKTSKTHRQVERGIDMRVPKNVRVGSSQKTSETTSKITYSQSRKGKDSDIEIVYVSAHKPNNLSNGKSHKSDKQIENKFGNKNIHSLNKRPYVGNDSRESPGKRPCTSIRHMQNNRVSAYTINNEIRDKRNSFQVEKSKRTVRFVENKDGQKSAQERGAAAKSKGNGKNLEHVSVVEALQKEGRRIMVDYLAEYETNSESSGDEGIVLTKSVRQTENIKFTVHLSSSMKTIKPYRCVLFDVIETNEGKAYSATTGRFIAPQKGTYGFFLTITSSKKEQPEVSIIHNFHPLESSKIKTNKQEDGEMQTKTDAILLSLEKNDEIWLLNVTRIAQVQQLENCHFLSFSGFLLKL